LIGMIFLMPLAGAAIGAASGAIAGALTDVGINDQFMKDAARVLDTNNAATCRRPSSMRRLAAERE
jgi:uncharacterized membrane protein